MAGSPVIVAGIDPGSRVTGFCALEVKGATMKVLRLEALRIIGRTKADKLAALEAGLSGALVHTRPSIVAVEAGYVGGWAPGRTASALMVAEFRGVALLIARSITPNVEEVSVGSARKAIGVKGGHRDQAKLAVLRAVCWMLRLAHAPREDAADAAALAIWAANRVALLHAVPF